MAKQDSISRFATKLQRPTKPGEDCSWSFLVIPKIVSDGLPRRGRTTVKGVINGHHFQATLDPDGQLGHWLKVSEELKKAARANVGDTIILEFVPVKEEPEPEIPLDFEEALKGAPNAIRVWKDTTTIARLDWIHWIVSAKQSKTRTKRILDACELLAAGKRRVCCFDRSGYYSKAFSLPDAAD